MAPTPVDEVADATDSVLPINIHLVSKNRTNLFFCFLSVKYEPISIKIVRIVRE